MKLERNEFMLIVEAISNKSFDAQYKKQIISVVENEIKKNKLDKRYLIDVKKFIEALNAADEEKFKELYLSIQVYWARRDPGYSMTGEEPVINITHENYQRIKAALKRFLILAIEKQAIKAGSIENLGLLLGQSEKYAQMILKRGSFSALERLYKEIKEKEESEKNEK